MMMMDHGSSAILRSISGPEQKSFSSPYSNSLSPTIRSTPSSPAPLPLSAQQDANFLNKNTNVVPSSASTSSISENYGVPPSSKGVDTTNVLLMLVSVICVTLYVSYYFWKRRRRGRACNNLRKLEDYSYSRLSQNEIDVDNVQLHHPVHDDDHQEDAAASTFSGRRESISSGENQDIHLLHDPAPATLHLEMDTNIAKHETNPTTIIDELSDEDLLQ